MSQAKVEQHKKEKANRKKEMAKQKAERVAGIACAWVILAALVGWAGYSGYQYYDSHKPEKTFYTNVSAVSDYLSDLNTETEE